MRKGILLGAIAGFLAGLFLSARGSLATGMAAHTLSPAGVQFFAAGIGVALFIAAACGIIGAFLGAVLEDVIAQK
jgi:hypothetical protein